MKERRNSPGGKGRQLAVKACVDKNTNLLVQ